MRRAIRTYGRFVAVIVTFAVIAVVTGGYILVHQRLPLPWQSQYQIKAEFENSEALEPGLGQPANVAGVKVGQITGAVLRNGRSVVTMTIDPGKLKHVYANASATLFSNTPLRDMEINIDPGTPAAPLLKSGQVIPLRNTTVPLSSDSLMHALDADTRQYFAALVAGIGTGVNGRGMDLNKLLRALGPTTNQLHELANALAARHAQLARVVHNLSILAVAASKKDTQLAQVVRAGNATLASLSSQDQALSQSLGLLPGTLAAAHASLGHAAAFADQLTPTLQALEPTAQHLPQTLGAARRLLDVAQPIVHTQAKPLVAAAKPVLADLLPTTTNLSASAPDVSNTAQLLQYLVNELSYNAGGSAHSYLFWLAWFVHDANSATSAQDANGEAIRGLLQVSCQTLNSVPAIQPLVGLITGVAKCP